MAADASSLNAALEGRYRIERELGEGGMAVVYLALDLRHDRPVALKVLKPEYAAAVGAARFLAEIRTTARLQHPHILPLFDSGEAGPFLFYVMPYVEGETLRARLNRDRQLPVDTSVRIATQVAEALEHAHGQGVVHRDIKPENVLIRDGEALVADFGIALALGSGTNRLTEAGLTIGTPEYMSPEQAMGEPHVGPRSDVWSLGCVLYEMLAGSTPFRAGTTQSILSRILTASPDALTSQRRAIPPHVAAVVARALEKVPSDRFDSARDFERALANREFRHGAERDRLNWRALAAALLAGVLLGSAGWIFRGDRGASRDATPIGFTIPGGQGNVRGHSITLSPDGSRIAKGAGDGGLIVYDIADFGTPTLIEPGTAVYPFFSPDGTRIAFFRDVSHGLVRMALAGGTPVQLVPGSGARALGGSWAANDLIVFANTTGLYSVEAAGGEPRLLKAPDRSRGEMFLAWPIVLPGDRFVLFSIVPLEATSDGDASLACLDLRNNEVTTVLEGGIGARYAATGHLVFSAQEGTLHSVPFDPATCRTKGDRTELPIHGLTLGTAWGPEFDIARNGTIVYLPATQAPATLFWMSRTGEEEPIPAPARRYGYVRIAPDGVRAALDLNAPGARDIHILDLERGTSVRLTREPGEEILAHWNDAGDSLYFSSNQLGGAFNVFRRAADGTGESELVFSSETTQMLNQVIPGRRGLLAAETRAGRDVFDVVMLSADRPARLHTLVSTPAAEFNAVVSPDGRFVAYQSDITGQFEVYVSPVEGAQRARWKVSVDGGEKPLWSMSGDTVFYRSAADSMMAVSVRRSPEFGIVSVSPLFAFGAGPGHGTISGRSWDLSPRDGRFLLRRFGPQSAGGIHVVVNWTRILERIQGR